MARIQLEATRSQQHAARYVKTAGDSWQVRTASVTSLNSPLATPFPMRCSPSVTQPTTVISDADGDAAVVASDESARPSPVAARDDDDAFLPSSCPDAKWTSTPSTTAFAARRRHAYFGHIYFGQRQIGGPFF